MTNSISETMPNKWIPIRESGITEQRYTVRNYLYINCEFHSYTTVKITVELRINTYFNGAFQCNLTMKFTVNLFASEIHS